MLDRAIAIADWQPFYEAMAQVAGALVGLVFVGLTFHAQMLRDARNRDLRTLAEQTFSDFVQLLIVSLMLLLPKMTAATFALVLLSTSAATLAGIARRLYPLIRTGMLGRRMVRQRFGLCLLAQAVLIGSAALVATNDRSDSGLMMTCVGLMMLLISGSRSAWYLIAHEISEAHEARDGSNS